VDYCDALRAIGRTIAARAADFRSCITLPANRRAQWQLYHPLLGQGPSREAWPVLSDARSLLAPAWAITFANAKQLHI
jgi:hypothetical protein